MQQAGLSEFYERSRTARKILVVDLGFLGDSVHLVPALWEIKRHYPAAELHTLSAPVGAEVLRLAPCVNRPWAFPLGAPSPPWCIGICCWHCAASGSTRPSTSAALTEPSLSRRWQERGGALPLTPEGNTSGAPGWSGTRLPAPALNCPCMSNGGRYWRRAGLSCRRPGGVCGSRKRQCVGPKRECLLAPFISRSTPALRSKSGRWSIGLI